MNPVINDPLKLFIVSLLLISWSGVGAQDLHLSQFHYSPANLNPGLTGLFSGDYRVNGNYRSQWQTVPVPYRTVSGSFDARLQHKLLGSKTFVGYGLVFNNDLAGDANMGLTQAGLNLACTRQLSESLYASLGLQLMTGQRSVQPDRLTFEEQWNGDIHDPSLSSNEAFSKSKSLSSVSTGLNLHYQVAGTRTKIDWGFGFFHLNQPQTSFTNDMDVSLPRKITSYFVSGFEIGPSMDLRFHVLFSQQLSYQELAGGAAVRYHLNVEPGKELAVQGGLGYRLKDAFIPSIGLQVRNWTAGLSYDINYSRFKAATNRDGGLEFYMEYIIRKVSAPKEFKACPVF